MAIAFSSGTTDKITVSNPLTFGAGTAFTVIFIAMRTGTPSNSQGWNKNANDLWVYFDNWIFNVGRAGTMAQAQQSVATGLMTENRWELIGLTYDESDGPRIFSSTFLTADIGFVERTYSERTVGTGDTTADSGDLFIGNRNSSSSLAAPLTVARFAMYNRRFSLPELNDHRLIWTPRSGCVCLYDFYGTGTQPDFSGNNKSGTVTGSASADHAPINTLYSNTRSIIPSYSYISGWGRLLSKSRNRLVVHS